MPDRIERTIRFQVDNKVFELCLHAFTVAHGYPYRRRDMLYGLTRISGSSRAPGDANITSFADCGNQIRHAARLHVAVPAMMECEVPWGGRQSS